MGRLRVLEVELEAVTPLWIGGADYQAELRSPSVRGCLRFWFRALIGGVLGESLPELRQAEGAVYGNTTQASSVAVRLIGSPQTATAFVEGEELPGISYLFWSVFQRKRDAIVPGERFRLRLQTRPWEFAEVEVAGRRLGPEETFELAAASLWLLLRLGNVGARGRHGAGAMQAIRNPEGWPAALPSLTSTAATPADLAAELGDGLARVRQAAGWHGALPQEISSFDLLHPRACQLYLVDRPFPSWREALDWVGQLYLAFRREHKLDATAVAGLLTRGRLAVQTIQRAILGLPLPFFFKSILEGLTSQGMDARDARRKASATVTPVRGQARTSPLFFRLLRLTGDSPSCALLLGVFRSRFLPDQEMTVRPADHAIRPVRVAVPADYSLLDNWFNYVRGQGTSLLPIPLA
jgi:CRISPR-associated protein Cmr1